MVKAPKRLLVGLLLLVSGGVAGFLTGLQWTGLARSRESLTEDAGTHLRLLTAPPAAPGQSTLEASTVPEPPAAPAIPSQQLPTAPLPPPLTPVRGWLDGVAERAQAGDNAAARRLHDELEACRAARWGLSQQRLPRDVLQLPIPRRAEVVVNMAEQEVQLCFRKMLCDGLTEAEENRGIHWLALAAERGDPRARFQFAYGDFISSRTLDHLELVPLYRARAWDWMTASMQAGSQDATLQLAEAYLAPDGPFQNGLAQLVAQDQVRGASLLYALFQLRLRSERTLEQTLALAQEGLTLDATQLAQARSDGMALYTAFLKGKKDPGWPRDSTTLTPVPLPEILRRAPHCLAPR